MIDKILHFFKISGGDSIIVRDSQTINRFKSNPDNPFLISFPRTGSHWLRMLMELYFERPSLVRVFYYPDRKDYLTLCTHDLDLEVNRKNVIYLYRNPVDTIFSQLSYQRESIDDTERIIYWSELYGRHLAKWLYLEEITSKKTILNYSKMQQDLNQEFKKITDHFGMPFDETRFKRVALQVTKEEVRKKTADDKQVIQLGNTYDETRKKFKKEFGNMVWESIIEERPYLINFFDIINIDLED